VNEKQYKLSKPLVTLLKKGLIVALRYSRKVSFTGAQFKSFQISKREVYQVLLAVCDNSQPDFDPASFSQIAWDCLTKGFRTAATSVTAFVKGCVYPGLGYDVKDIDGLHLNQQLVWRGLKWSEPESAKLQSLLRTGLMIEQSLSPIPSNLPSLSNKPKAASSVDSSAGNSTVMHDTSDDTRDGSLARKHSRALSDASSSISSSSSAQALIPNRIGFSSPVQADESSDASSSISSSSSAQALSSIGAGFSSPLQPSERQQVIAPRPVTNFSTVGNVFPPWSVNCHVGFVLVQVDTGKQSTSSLSKLQSVLEEWCFFFMTFSRQANSKYMTLSSHLQA
jgi:hypothetical protein